MNLAELTLEERARWLGDPRDATAYTDRLAAVRAADRQTGYTWGQQDSENQRQMLEKLAVDKARAAAFREAAEWCDRRDRRGMGDDSASALAHLFREKAAELEGES